MIEPVIYGEMRDDELIAPTHCAISGIKLQPGDAMVRVKGTPFYYGIAAQVMHQLTNEKRAELDAAAPRPVTPLSRQLKVPKEGE